MAEKCSCGHFAYPKYMDCNKCKHNEFELVVWCRKCKAKTFELYSGIIQMKEKKPNDKDDCEWCGATVDSGDAIHVWSLVKDRDLEPGDRWYRAKSEELQYEGLLVGLSSPGWKELKC